MEEQELSYEAIKKEIEELSALADRKCSQFLTALDTGILTEIPENRTFLLGKNMSELSGQKPCSVNFPDGTFVSVRTWAETAKAVLQYCCQDEGMHEHLKQLCDHVAGQKRVLLSNQKEIMQKPVEIEKEIYLEGQHSPSDMMHVLKHQILDRIGCDYSNISVLTQGRPKIKYLPERTPEETAGLKSQIQQKWDDIHENLRKAQELLEKEQCSPESSEEPEESGMIQQL
ncbi:MAG: hypothetical protein IJ642_05600 [Oscillospiraceae bacterium]|nr:hypothetical protein [Oscillospiraceae bacterium]